MRLIATPQPYGQRAASVRSSDKAREGRVGDKNQASCVPNRKRRPRGYSTSHHAGRNSVGRMVRAACRAQVRDGGKERRQGTRGSPLCARRAAGQPRDLGLGVQYRGNRHLGDERPRPADLLRPQRLRSQHAGPYPSDFYELAQGRGRGTISMTNGRSIVAEGAWETCQSIAVGAFSVSSKPVIWRMSVQEAGGRHGAASTL